MTLTFIIIAAVVIAGVIIYSMRDDDHSNWDD
jgi:formate hydrogenlyase subunit 3/multisubunit Na+/H+ antiporter MnhD subunit